MSTRLCDRAALVEAMVDGRLGPSEQASTERHLKNCHECAERLRDLTTLRQTLRSSSRALSPLDHQRARLTLLRQAAIPPTRKARLPLVLLAAATATLPFVVWAASSASPWRPREVPVSPASVTTSPVLLTPKTLITAPSSSSDEPAPTASATAQMNEAPIVSVQTFPTSPGPAPTPPTPVVQESSNPSPLPSPVLSTPARTDPRASVPRLPSIVTTAPRRDHDEPTEKRAPIMSSAPSASPEFNEAMAMLARGDFSTSASQLDGFASAHPDDPRAEEATYLQAIALERAGRRNDARDAARRYLARYPMGAHRAQASRLAND